MATADYRLCDVCDGKTFYDAHLNYEQGRASEWAKRQAPFRWAGEEQGKPEHDDYLLRLDYLGDWAVICSNCAKTHKTTVVPIESAPDEPIADSDADYWLRNRRPILDAIERAGFMLMSNASGFWLHPRGKTEAQAEPKREPLSDERIDTALQTEPVLITRLMIGSMTVGEFKAALRRVARIIEHAHGIGDSDEHQ